MLGTLAARERKDPVVVVSGDRDLLQLVRDDPVSVRVLYLGRGLAKATKYGPAEVAEQLRRPGRPGRTGLRRTGVDAGRSVRRTARRSRRRREDGGHNAGSAWLAGGHTGRRPRPEIEDVQGVSDEAAGGHRLHRGRRDPWCGWPPTPTSAIRRSPTICHWPPTSAEGGQTRRPVRRDVIDRPATEGTGPTAERELTTWACPPRRCRRRPGMSPSPAVWCRRC